MEKKDQERSGVSVQLAAVRAAGGGGRGAAQLPSGLPRALVLQSLPSAGCSV